MHILGKATQRHVVQCEDDKNKIGKQIKVVPCLSVMP